MAEKKRVRIVMEERPTMKKESHEERYHGIVYLSQCFLEKHGVNMHLPGDIANAIALIHNQAYSINLIFSKLKSGLLFPWKNSE